MNSIYLKCLLKSVLFILFSNKIETKTEFATSNLFQPISLFHLFLIIFNLNKNKLRINEKVPFKKR
jgi:hypothetical protein